MARVSEERPSFIETPRGLFTPSGLWFRTTREALSKDYGEVLEATPLEVLIKRAERWLHSHQDIALWGVLPVLFYAGSTAAWVTGLVLFVGWRILAPALGHVWIEYVLRALSWVPVQLVAYVGVLSLVAASGSIDRLIAGLAWFVVVRWRLLGFVTRPLTGWLIERLYPLPLADQMLRSVIYHTAIHKRIPLDDFPAIGGRTIGEEE